MLPILPILVASGVLAVGTKAASKRLGKPGKPKGLPQTLAAALNSAQRVDDRYQHFVQTRIDPLLINSERAEQLAHISAGRQRVIGEHEKSINRHIAIGFGAVATVGVAHLTALYASTLSPPFPNLL